MRAMKVCVDNDSIAKKFDKGEQSLFWNDIVSVKLIKNPTGNYINIIIYGKDKKKIYLFGFDRMHEIVELIKEKVSDNVDITTRQNKIDYDNRVFLALVGIISLVIIALFHKGGQNLEDVFNAIVCMAAGSFILIYRPLSKTNLSFKHSEKFLGWGLILMALLMLIGL